MNKLYLDSTERTKTHISGTIYDRPLKDKLNNFRVYFSAERLTDNTYLLEINRYKRPEVFFEVIDESHHGKMNLKNILYFVENKIKTIKSVLNYEK